MSGIKERPKYYKNTSNDLDVIDIVKMFDLNFNLGNILKYIVRQGKKEDTIQDLKKAREYLDREIYFLTKE